MHSKMVSIFSCPYCKNDLRVDSKLTTPSLSDNNDDIPEGILTCLQCEKYYPIIEGIPRLCVDLSSDEIDGTKRIKTTNQPRLNL